MIIIKKKCTQNFSDVSLYFQQYVNQILRKKLCRFQKESKTDSTKTEFKFHHKIFTKNDSLFLDFLCRVEKPEHQGADFYATTVILLKPGIMKMLLGEFQGPPGLMTHCAGLMAVTPLKLNHPKTILVSFMLKLVIKR